MCITVQCDITTTKAGKGLKELDYNAVLHVITESIG